MKMFTDSFYDEMSEILAERGYKMVSEDYEKSQPYLEFDKDTLVKFCREHGLSDKFIDLLIDQRLNQNMYVEKLEPEKHNYIKDFSKIKFEKYNKISTKISKKRAEQIKKDDDDTFSL